MGAGGDSDEQATLGGDWTDSDRTAAEAEAVAGDGGPRGEAVVRPGVAGLPDAEGTVSVAVTQVDYKVEGTGADEEPFVHVFGRTEGGDLEHVRVRGFRPYFYAPTDSIDDEDLAHDRITGWEDTDDDGEPYESIRGERLTKIFGQTPRDVGEIRDRFEHYEADILFPNRFLIDKDVRSGLRVPDRRAADVEGVPAHVDDGVLVVHHSEVETADVQAPPRVHTLDIEVDDRQGFPEDGEETILCLTAHDSLDDEYVTWLYVAPDLHEDATVPDDLPGYEPIEGEGVALDVRTFESEAAMLADYVDYLTGTDADIVTGWNCLPADSEVQMADGRTKEIRNVTEGDEVVGVAGQDPTVAEVTNKWRSEKRIYSFDLADGTTLRASGGHRVMVGDDKAVDWKRGEAIEPGDYVLKPRRLPVENPEVPTLDELVPRKVQRFATEEMVKEFKTELPYGAVAELAEDFDLAAGTLYHPKTDVWTPERCQRAAGRYDVAVPDGGRVYRRTGRQLDRKLSAQEVYLAGLVLADGSMSRDDGLRFYNTRPELHEEFPGDNNLEPDGKGCYKQNVLDHALMYAFNGLGIPFGDKNAVDVDLSTVYRMPEQYISHFLAGVIDGDGNVNDSVSVSAKNPTIRDWYVRLFKRLGIYAGRRGRVVRIPDAEREIERLKETVLPHISHPEKRSDIEALQGGKSGRSENIPYALFESEEGSEKRRIGNDKHRRNINLKRHDTVVDDWTEYVFVEVESVEVADTEATYDIETTTHNFFAEDCLVHNCDDFDVPYLLDRLERLDPRTDEYDLDPDLLSRIGEVWRSDWGGPDVKGRVVFDLLRGYRSMARSELDSYRLDAVGEEELGVGKERYPGDIGDLWEDDPTRLLEYNLRDVEICVELDRSQPVVAFYQEVAAFVGCKMEDAPTAGDAVDMYVLHKAHGEFALPSKGQVEEGEEFEGGAVFEPVTGVKEMVSVLDLKSLYPMAMRTINASPETKVDDAYEGDVYEAPNGTRFRKQPDGIMREMITELLDEREDKKDRRDEHAPDSDKYQLYDRQQSAVKVIMNSLYGVSGWTRFRLYDKDAAAAVTATGREVIEFTEEVASSLNYQVTYGDTDSVMLELGGGITKAEAIEQSFGLEEQMNDSYGEFAERLGADEHFFEIEFEKLYRRFFQAGKKKRYAGNVVWSEGKDVDDIDITGFEYKRSDIAPITKEVQERVIEMIVRGEDLGDVKDYVHDVIEDFRAGAYDYDDVGIPSGIGKRLDNYDTDTAQVRGAKYANLLLGTNFQRGSKPKRLYLSKVHPDFFDRVEGERELDPQENPVYREFKESLREGKGVICFEYADQVPEEFEVDWDKMLDKTLRGPIARVLEGLGVSWEEVRDGQEQTGFGDFT